MTQDLKNFTGIEATNFFSNDTGFQDLLNFILGPEKKERLSAVLHPWGARLSHWDLLAKEASRPEKLPRVEKQDRVGNPIEKIVLPLETQTIRKEVVEGGIFESQSELEKISIVYLLAHLGEAGIMCPLACTDGLIRVIKDKGSDFLKQTCLPLLKSAKYPLAGAQFITEQSGGSDVGAIEGIAQPNGDGSFRIHAEKWYCSATDEFFLIAARPEGAPPGTKGVAIFFVPRLMEGHPNRLSIRRLKDKMGTQSLPTAEIDFLGSRAYLIGDANEGFHNLMAYVLNASRIHNAANCLGLLHRTFIEARNYASQRVAFGQEIIGYPMVQESLLTLEAHLYSKRALFFGLVHELDRNGFIAKDRDQNLWQRCLINLMKYRTAVISTSQIKNAILIMGANGIIEDFSILPRLLRDSLVVETWEGAHNILCLQILRDSFRFDLMKKIDQEIAAVLDLWQSTVLAKSRKLYEKAFGHFREMVKENKAKDMMWVQSHARRFIDLIGNLLEIGFLQKQAINQKNHNLFAYCSHLTHLYFEPDPFANPVVNSLPNYGLKLIQELPVSLDVEKI